MLLYWKEEIGRLVKCPSEDHPRVRGDQHRYTFTYRLYLATSVLCQNGNVCAKFISDLTQSETDDRTTNRFTPASALMHSHEVPTLSLEYLFL